MVSFGYTKMVSAGDKWPVGMVTNKSMGKILTGFLTNKLTGLVLDINAAQSFIGT